MARRSGAAAHKTPVMQAGRGPRRRPKWEIALRLESDRARGEMIRGNLALPMAKRVGFLRVRLPDGSGSHV